MRLCSPAFLLALLSYPSLGARLKFSSEDVLEDEDITAANETDALEDQGVRCCAQTGQWCQCREAAPYLEYYCKARTEQGLSWSQITDHMRRKKCISCTA